jgi:hypothetical protein
MRILFGLSLILLSSAKSSQGQPLKPGFDIEEMLEVMYVSARTGSDSTYYRDSNYIPDPARFKRLYKSPVIGLENLYEIWTSEKTAIISVRGTVAKPESWLANIYSAMIPAKGSIKISETDSFFLPGCLESIGCCALGMDDLHRVHCSGPYAKDGFAISVRLPRRDYHRPQPGRGYFLSAQCLHV